MQSLGLVGVDLDQFWALNFPGAVHLQQTGPIELSDKSSVHGGVQHIIDRSGSPCPMDVLDRSSTY